MRQDASRSGYEWLGQAVFVVCVQSYKKDSPSSGLFRVKVYNEHGMAQKNGTGMFPREVMNRFPLLPSEEEGRLNDMPLRENFIERVFACPALSAGPTIVGRRCWTGSPRPAAWSLANASTAGSGTPQDRQVPYSTQAHAHGPRDRL